jgi:hypothetical protein
MAIYKRTPTLQVGVTISIPTSSHKPLEHSAHPIVTLISFNITQLDMWLLPPRRGLNQDRSLCVSCS